MRFWRYGAMLCKPSQVPNHLLHQHWNRGGSTDGTDSNEGLPNGDYSNGIFSFSALSPVFSFHLYIKIGLWISTEPTASFTRRSSWMRRERNVTMSWIRWFTRIHFSERIGVWNIEALQNNKTIGVSKQNTPIALLIRTDITFICQPLSIRVLLLQ